MSKKIPDSKIDFHSYKQGVVEILEPQDYVSVIGRLAQQPRILHAIMGIVTESAEIMDAYKKYSIYGTELDAVNLKEEIGDIMWYIGLLCQALDIPLEECLAANEAKLRVRYPKGFSEEAALNRDINNERKVLGVTPENVTYHGRVKGRLCSSAPDVQNVPKSK